MERALVELNPHWTQGLEKHQHYYNRKLLRDILKHKKEKQIEVILGVRRSGKSTILKLTIRNLIKKVNEKTILFLNFDNPIFIPYYNKPEKLNEIIKKAETLTGEKINYLFLDEIQNIEHWEKWLKSIYDLEKFKKIYISGSNSHLLETQYTERLSGRYFKYYCFPFSFRELLSTKKINPKSELDLISKENIIIKLFKEYMEYGGFPEVIDSKYKKDLLKVYYDTITLKDCIISSRIRIPNLFRELSYYLISNVGKPYTYNSLAKITNSNENTMKDYILPLKQSFLAFELNTYSYSIKKQLKKEKKLYFIDTGLINAVSFKFSENKGRILENLVAIELKRRNKEIYYYKGKQECDFLIKQGTKITEAIQVCYELNEDNKKRELKGLREAMKEFKLKKGLLLTYDQEDTIDNITIKPVWKWLLQKS